jgi:hypothetical protein
MDFSADFFDWIQANASADPSRLRLKYGAARAFEILQIECRRRHGAKIASTLAENPHFIFPTALSGEQSTSDRLARFHASLIKPESRVADLTSGLGIDAMAVARHSSVTAVELNPIVADALRYNSSALNKFEVVNADCRDFIRDAAARGDYFDYIFIDPARRRADGSRIFALSECQPSVVDMLPTLRKICKTLIIKASPMLDIAHTLVELPDAAQLIALGTTTECKELDIICDFDAQPLSLSIIKAVTLTQDSLSEFSFTRDEEQAAEATYGLPEVGQLIFDPYPAVMKAGAMKLLSQRFGLSKLAPNTHLWYGSSRVEDFPGHAYQIVEVLPYASKNIKRYASRYPRVGVTVRNFDIAADVLRAKLGVKDGPDRLFAASTQSARLLITTTPC